MLFACMNKIINSKKFEYDEGVKCSYEVFHAALQANYDLYANEPYLKVLFKRGVEAFKNPQKYNLVSKYLERGLKIDV